MAEKAYGTARDERDTPRTNRNRPIECDVCGLKLRGAFGPLERIGLPTCACGGQFIWRREADGYRSSDPYACPAVAEAESLHDRRLARVEAAHSLALKRTTVGQCGGCRKPIKATNEHCARCGFENDLRGNVNHGRYADACPF